MIERLRCLLWLLPCSLLEESGSALPMDPLRELRGERDRNLRVEANDDDDAGSFSFNLRADARAAAPPRGERERSRSLACFRGESDRGERELLGEFDLNDRRLEDGVAVGDNTLLVILLLRRGRSYNV